MTCTLMNLYKYEYKICMERNIKFMMVVTSRNVIRDINKVLVHMSFFIS